MLIKTVEFNERFIKDVSDIAIYKRKYVEDLSKVSKERLQNIGFGNQITKNVIFVGSYFGKPFGSIISDIDMAQFINFDEKIVFRISDIMKNLHRTNFIFVRFYCGSIQELNFPWKIDGKGTCNYDPDKIQPWLVQIRQYLPGDVYNNIQTILNSESISISDLVSVENMIEPYSSINWTIEDLVRGYKDYKNKRYNLLETLKSYDKKKVLKFIYRTIQNGRYEYCLIDCSLKEYQCKSETTSDIIMKSYYNNDIYQKVKSIKHYLTNEYRDNEYKKLFKEKVGLYTSLAARIEFIDKVEKYKLLNENEINSLRERARQFAVDNNLASVNYRELQSILGDKVSELYDIFRKKVPNMLRKGKEIIEAKKNLSILEIRGEEGKIKVDKETIRKRLNQGYQCPFFLIDIEQLNFLVQKCIDALIDPLLLSKCITSREAVFVDNRLYIEKEEDRYILKRRNSLFSIVDGDLKALQTICLFSPHFTETQKLKVLNVCISPDTYRKPRTDKLIEKIEKFKDVKNSDIMYNYIGIDDELQKFSENKDLCINSIIDPDLFTKCNYTPGLYDIIFLEFCPVGEADFTVFTENLFRNVYRLLSVGGYFIMPLGYVGKLYGTMKLPDKDLVDYLKLFKLHFQSIEKVSAYDNRIIYFMKKE
jgi:hypothetical protein